MEKNNVGTSMIGTLQARLHASSIVRYAFICGAVCGIFILGLELVSRLIIPDKIALWRGTGFFARGEVVFITAGANQNSDGFPTYRANADARRIVYYPDKAGSPTIEYDCPLRSDKRGFVSNSTEYNNSEILLLGDSFTVGLGGCEWISRLKTDIGSRLYVAAHPGYGVIHWQKVVTHLEAIKRPEKILIVFITEDFFRPGWLYSKAQLDCLDLQGGCDGQWYYPITSDLGEVAKDRLAQAAKKGERQNKGAVDYLRHHLVASTALWRIFTQKATYDLPVLRESIAIVFQLAAKYDLKLLWVNEKYESPVDNAQTRLLATKLGGTNLTRCKNSSRGFSSSGQPSKYVWLQSAKNLCGRCASQLVTQPRGSEVRVPEPATATGMSVSFL